MGGVTAFDQGIASEICARIAEGESVRSICKDPRLPVMSTVFKWLNEQPTFSEQYARAKEIQLERMAEEILDISDDSSNDWMERATRSGDVETVVDHEHVTRSRLRVDSRKWLLSKLMPKKYGEKTALELTGKDGGPVQYENMTDEQLESRIADLLAKAGTGAAS